MAATLEESRKRELEAFDDTKTGVKGLVDTGITKIPKIFINSQKTVPQNLESEYSNYSIPIVDLGILREDEKSKSIVVDQIRHACETCGFFLLINHGICSSTLDGILEGVRKFHEQENVEVKKKFYTREPGKKVMYHSNFTLFTAAAADWRDTLNCRIAPIPPMPEELPQIYRDAFYEYSKEVMKLGRTLLELMSMALGLDPNHLNDIGCGEGAVLLGNYYPKCPQPELTLGASKHTDTSSVTILIQDQVGGLQVLHENKWVDVCPVAGSLVVNLGDFMQLITNDKFKSVDHRVLASTGSRASVACFIRPYNASRNYGPIKELLSEGEAPIYKDLTIKEFDSHFLHKGLNGVRTIEHFKFWTCHDKN